MDRASDRESLDQLHNETVHIVGCGSTCARSWGAFDMTRALQKLIHIACRDLGLDTDARRDLQVVVCGKSSMSDMTEAELTQVLDRLKQSGFKASSTGRRPAAPRADLRLIHVLWRKLGEAGALERPDRVGLNAFIRSRFGETWASVPADIDMLRDVEQIEAVVAALKAWGQRADIDFNWKRGRR
ncbi:gp16 family protein [Pseudosulfitobacter pseudonitzschiae]|uniref:gp16 family protein n=2 Tax=Pseudosulfitobacter pseudonitzschiae TaxID=1402135 RepID=UPI003264AE6C